MWNLLKLNSKDCASLWTTCNKSATLFKCFSLNRFHTLIYFYLLWGLYWVQKKPPDVFFRKRCFLKLRNIYRKMSVLESLFDKFVDLHACNYMKKRLQQRCFLWDLRKFWRTPFLKNIYQLLFSKSLTRMG